MEIVNFKEYLLTLNETVSCAFVRRIGKRRQARIRRPTEFMVTECMDGRVDFMSNCGSELGMLTILENIGGRFEMGWPLLVEDLKKLLTFAHTNYLPPVCLIATYHWSASDKHLGCAGFNYKVNMAFEHVLRFVHEFNDCFNEGQRAYGIMIGIETDTGSLRLVNPNNANDIISTADVKDAAALKNIITKIWDFLPEKTQTDLVYLLMGNINKLLSAQLTTKRSPQKTPQHQERILCLGSSFDWLTSNTKNLCLTISGHDPMITEAIEKAASIIFVNYFKKRIPSGGLVFACYPYRIGFEKKLAQRQADYMLNVAKQVIGEMSKKSVENRGITSFFKFMAGTVDLGTRKIEIIK